jgi:hypothetical protein
MPTSLQADQESWANLAMGELGHLDNTFWETFHLAGPADRWSLVTPPGVADNGGIVATTAPAATAFFVAGFETSQDLGFSPLASSTTGAHWAPAILPRALARVPDALAEDDRGDVLALLAEGHGTVLESHGALASWHTLVSASSLARASATSSCGVSRITAVAYTTTGMPIVGTACARSGQLGLFADGPDGWRDVASDFGRGFGGRSELLRLSSASGRLVALVAETRRATTALVAGWSSSSGDWSSSGSLVLGNGEQVVASATSPTALAVLLRRSGTERVVVTSGDAHSWSTLPAVPRGPVSIALDRGRVDAFVVVGSKLSDYVLQAREARWRRAQVIEVPIQYSSSG